MSFIYFKFTTSGDNFGFDKKARIDIALELEIFIDYFAYEGRYPLSAIEIENLDIAYFRIIEAKYILLSSFKNKYAPLEGEDIWDDFSEDQKKNIIEKIKAMFDKNQNELLAKLDEALADQAVAEAERRAEEAYERYY